ncbi:PAS domain-containing protein, partial [Acinetobacter baumannii]|nr:PAS domain-containing protein [Acinetobacter baumannii]
CGIAPDAPPPDFETLLACVHPDDREFVEEEIAQALQHGTPLDLTHRLVRDGGTVRHVHARGELVLRKNADPTFYGTLQDIKERHRAEQSPASLAQRL